jgi:hypothetical protein
MSVTAGLLVLNLGLLLAQALVPLFPQHEASQDVTVAPEVEVTKKKKSIVQPLDFPKIFNPRASQWILSQSPRFFYLITNIWHKSRLLVCRFFSWRFLKSIRNLDFHQDFCMF